MLSTTGTLLARAERGVAAVQRRVDQLHELAARGDEALGNQLMVPTTGNRLQVINGLTPWMQQLSRDIDHTPAGSWIAFESYALMKPENAASPMSGVLDSLRRATQRGVRIIAMPDAFGSGTVGHGAQVAERRAFLQSLRDQGIDVRVSPVHLAPRKDTPLFGLTHRKAWVLDGGRVAYSGGINAVDEWASWHDAMTRVEGPAAAQIGARLLARYRDLGGTPGSGMVRDLESGLRTPVTDSRYAVRYLTNGGRSRREISASYLSMLRGARGNGADQVLMTSPFMSDPLVLKAATDAARRGVDLTLFIAPPPVELKEHFFIAPFRLMWAHDILAAGGKVVMSDRFSHYKGIVLRPSDPRDAKLAVANIGSCNFDSRSIRYNRENNIESNDPEFVAGAMRGFDELRANGRELASSDLRGWRWRAFVARELGLRY